jgi:hypothetical protein
MLSHSFQGLLRVPVTPGLVDATDGESGKIFAIYAVVLYLMYLLDWT